MDTSDRDHRIQQVIAAIAELAETTRRERDRRASAGDDTAWFDQVLTELEPLVDQTRDLEVVEAIRAVVDRHGPGPYPSEELATIAGIDDADRLARVLNRLVAEGLARPEGGDQP